jgi:hypothetical protein
MKLLTAKKGEPHFTSMHFRAMLEGICGSGSYIAENYEKLETELSPNNVIKIRSGMLIHHGGLYLVEPGTYDEVSYINGTQGMKRIDLVVARYTQDADTGIENGEWVVIQGTPAESDPVAPEYTIGNMQEGDIVDDCPVFAIHFDGITVTEIKTLLETVPSVDCLNGNTNRFIDTSKMLFEKQDANTNDNIVHELWTATENCWCVICAKAADENTYCSTIRLDGKEVAWFYQAQYTSVVFPVKKGQQVSKGNGTVFAYFYAMS